MKEKYVGKVKVPFCVRVDAFDSIDREELMGIYRELGVHTPFIASMHKYDGVEENGTTVDCWDNVEAFGENTTVHTLEELQAIIDGVNNVTIAPSQPEAVSSEYVEWGDWEEGDEVVFCGFSDQSHSHWSFTVGETYVVKEDNGIIAPMSDKGSVPEQNWGFNFKKKSVEKTDGWIPWSGGLCPVLQFTLVDVKHRSGQVYTNEKAGLGYCNYWGWDDGKSNYEIVAYRIVVARLKVYSKNGV